MENSSESCAIYILDESFPQNSISNLNNYNKILFMSEYSLCKKYIYNFMCIFIVIVIITICFVYNIIH